MDGGYRFEQYVDGVHVVDGVIFVSKTDISNKKLLSIKSFYSDSPYIPYINDKNSKGMRLCMAARPEPNELENAGLASDYPIIIRVPTVKKDQVSFLLWVSADGHEEMLTLRDIYKDIYTLKASEDPLVMNAQETYKVWRDDSVTLDTCFKLAKDALTKPTHYWKNHDI